LLERVPARELILVTRHPAKLSEFAARGASVRRGDFDDPASLPAAFAGGERMLLISTDKVGGGRPAQHGRAIDAAVRAGVRHIAYTSFVNADVPGHPAISCSEHRDTEPLVKGSGVDWTILRNNQYAEALAEFVAPAALASGRWVSCSRAGRVGFLARGLRRGGGGRDDDIGPCGPHLQPHRARTAVLRVTPRRRARRSASGIRRGRRGREVQELGRDRRAAPHHRRHVEEPGAVAQ
jgi:hypothetical protein